MQLATLCDGGPNCGIFHTFDDFPYPCVILLALKSHMYMLLKIISVWYLILYINVVYNSLSQHYSGETTFEIQQTPLSRLLHNYYLNLSLNITKWTFEENRYINTLKITKSAKLWILILNAVICSKQWKSMIKIKFHVNLRPMWSMRILFLLSLTFSFGSFLSEEIIEDEDEGTQYTWGKCSHIFILYNLHLQLSTTTL